jgi:flagellar biosynthesis protein FlhF
MRLKLYRALSVAEAMRAIRDELGPEALILSTRRVADGVEVTAALEATEPEAAGAPPQVAVPEAPPPPQPASARALALAWHGVPPALTERLERGASLAGALSASLRFGELNLQPDSQPLLMVGAPGVGKTLTVARLATRLVMNGATPMVITTDGRRAGATEQLAAFTRLLGISLIVAGNPVMLARALARRRDGAPVLIDAPGTDAFDPAQRLEMRELAATADATVALVVPAGHDPAEAADEAEAFAETGSSVLLATRLDLARRLGAVLAAAHAGGLALAEAGIGPGAADGMVAMTPAFLADRLSVPRPAPRAPLPQEAAKPPPEPVVLAGSLLHARDPFLEERARA